MDGSRPGGDAEGSGDAACAFGPDAEDAIARAIGDYYGGRPAAGAPRQGRSNATSAEAVRDAVRLHEELGTDEMIFRPAILDPDQVDRLAEAVGQSSLG